MRFLPISEYSRNGQKGIAALLMVMTIAFFLFIVGILIAVQGNTSIFAGQFEGQGDRAQFLAQAGIDDAKIRLARDSTFSGSYTITATDGTVAVSVTAGTPVTIRATSTVTRNGESSQRAMQALVSIDSNGKITSATTTNQ
jgi:hypothetical protein